jgi:hypothetical protein
MADEEQDREQSDGGDDPCSPDGFAVQLPAGLGSLLHQHAVRQHDRHHMEIESIEMRINNFLDSLDVEGLLVMRKILNADRDSGPNNYFDGMVVTILRVVHHVDADGRTQAELLAEAEERMKRS